MRKKTARTPGHSSAIGCRRLIACAQYQTSPDQLNAPTALQSTTPDRRPPLATLPEATDGAAVPRRQTTGQSPNVSKKMGAEMDSAGDQQASPDEQ